MRRSAVTMAGVALVLSGCASIPSTSQIREVEEPAADAPDLVVGVHARPPRPGASPAEIVTGFLEASGAVNYFQVAPEYLAPDVARPSRVVVYVAATQPTEVASGDGVAEVRVVATKAAELNEQRAFVPEPGAGTEIDRRFTLTQVPVDDRAEWRISEAPDTLLIADIDFRRQYEQYTPYYFDSGQRILVPDPIYLRGGPEPRDLANELVDAWFDGPTSWLAPAVKTGLPAGVGRTPDTNVDIDRAGIATVEVTTGGTGLTAAQRENLLAQLAWTLAGLPDVEAVSVSIDGQPRSQPRTPADVDSVRPAGAGEPAGGRRSAYALTEDGRLAVQPVGQGRVSPVRAEGPFGAEDGPALAEFAIGSGGDVVAGVTEDRTEVYLTRGPNYVNDGRPVITGQSLRSPSWDGFGRLWILDQRAAGSVVRVLAPDGVLRDVEVEGLTGRIEQLAVSEDGARAALTVSIGDTRSAEIWSVADDASRLVNPRPLAPQLASVTDVTWRDGGSELAVLASAQAVGGLQPYLVSLDSWQLEAQVIQTEAETITAAAGLPILVGTEGGVVYQEIDGSWEVLGEGIRAPRYPG